MTAFLTVFHQNTTSERFNNENSTANPGGPVWNFSACFTLVVCVSSLSLNGTIFAVFLKNSQLRNNPFSVHLMFLLWYNLLLAGFQNPLGVVESLYKRWWLGKGWCVVYRYSGSVITALGMYTHVLVTFSRLWAISFPISYRRIYTKKTAVSLCICMAIYVHMIYLPEFIPKMVLINSATLNNCRNQYTNSIHVQFIMYVGAISIMLLAYPFIYHKQRQRIKERMARVGPSVVSSGQVVGSGMEQSDARSGLHNTLEVSETTHHRQRLQRADPRSYGFAVLTLLTCSATICWTPATVIFLVHSFKPIKYSMIFQIALTLFSIQPILDPILFTIALADLRRAFRKTFCVRKRVTFAFGT